MDVETRRGLHMRAVCGSFPARSSCATAGVGGLRGEDVFHCFLLSARYPAARSVVLPLSAIAVFLVSPGAGAVVLVVSGVLHVLVFRGLCFVQS